MFENCASSVLFDVEMRQNNNGGYNLQIVIIALSYHFVCRILCTWPRRPRCPGDTLVSTVLGDSDVTGQAKEPSDSLRRPSMFQG